MQKVATVTQDNKDKIYSIVKEHLNNIDVLKVIDIPLETRARAIYSELQPIHKKLDDQKLLPEGMTWEMFHNYITHVLEVIANHLLRFRSFA